MIMTKSMIMPTKLAKVTIQLPRAKNSVEGVYPDMVCAVAVYVPESVIELVANVLGDEPALTPANF